MSTEGAKTVAEAIATECVSGRIGSVSAAGESRVHSTREMAAGHVSTVEAAGSAESTGVAARALGAEGHS